MSLRNTTVLCQWHFLHVALCVPRLWWRRVQLHRTDHKSTPERAIRLCLAHCHSAWEPNQGIVCGRLFQMFPFYIVAEYFRNVHIWYHCIFRCYVMCDEHLKSLHYTQNNAPLYAIANIGFLFHTLFRIIALQDVGAANSSHITFLCIIS